MDPSKVPTNPQQPPTENPSLRATSDEDSYYNLEGYDLSQASLNYISNVLEQEATEDVNWFDSLLQTNPEPSTATNQSNAEDSSYSGQTYDFSNTVFNYLDDGLLEGELENRLVNEFVPTPFLTNLKAASSDPVLPFAEPGSARNDALDVSAHSNVTDCTLVDGSGPSPFPANPLSIPSLSLSLSLSLPSLATLGSDEESIDFPYAVLNYIKDMLMEGDLMDKPCMLQDCIALQAAEKSLYDVLVEKDPTSDLIENSRSENFGPCDSTSVVGCNSCNSTSAGTDSFEQFKRAVEDTNKSFLRSPEPGKEEVNRRIASQSSGRKNHEREDDSYSEEGRSNKHSLASTEESEQLKILDNMFLHQVENNEPMSCPLYDTMRNEASRKFQEEEKMQSSMIRVKRLIGNREKVDLWALLNQCAQAAGSGDQREAAEKLRQIRQHSSPYGDADQRLSHYFANGLEARLSGAANAFQAPVFGHLTATSDFLKAYQLYVSICPFTRMSNYYTNMMIAKRAENKMSLHIFDFGIGYGFQWPCFLHRLSTRPGGPPMVRITGIEFPQRGFRPAGRVEETGRRLQRLAEALAVPFEYNAIAKKWEEIRYEDLNIDRDEMIAVTCMYRLKDLPDDTMVRDSPRDAVLKLIRKINPVIFVHGIVNGSYNASFFGTRFREALFHFSALFDMFEANTPQEDQERLIFEREIIGKRVFNVIAMEGFERVERPETYKQWQSRNCRVGFRQRLLDKDLMRNVRAINNTCHKDFTVEEDGKWLLMGWKGRIIRAVSAWKPTP